MLFENANQIIDAALAHAARQAQLKKELLEALQRDDIAAIKAAAWQLVGGADDEKSDRPHPTVER